MAGHRGGHLFTGLWCRCPRSARRSVGRRPGIAPAARLLQPAAQEQALESRGRMGTWRGSSSWPAWPSRPGLAEPRPLWVAAPSSSAGFSFNRRKVRPGFATSHVKAQGCGQALRLPMQSREGGDGGRAGQAPAWPRVAPGIEWPWETPAGVNIESSEYRDGTRARGHQAAAEDVSAENPPSSV